jgi:carbon storage regulator
MLVLARKVDEKIVCKTLSGQEVEIMVVSIRGNQVRLGINAPNDIKITREDPVRH